MRSDFDLSVYFIADPSLCAGRAVTDVVAAALRGGATLVQLRCKDPAGDKMALARAVLEQHHVYFRQTGWRVPLLINDYVDIAAETGADGVHLGQGDIAPAQARALLGPSKIIGLTAFTPEHIKAVDPDVVDYIGTGPFYATKTDKGKPVLGPEKFAALAALSPVPVVGIGGITPGNAGAVLEAGAHGVAMMRSVSESPDPEKAVEDFVKVVRAFERAQPESVVKDTRKEQTI